MAQAGGAVQGLEELDQGCFVERERERERERVGEGSHQCDGGDERL